MRKKKKTLQLCAHISSRFSAYLTNPLEVSYPPAGSCSAALHGPFATEVEAAYARDKQIVKDRPAALLNFPPDSTYHLRQKLTLPPPERSISLADSIA